MITVNDIIKQDNHPQLFHQLISETTLLEYVAGYFTRKEEFMELWYEAGEQSIYILDIAALKEKAKHFKKAFRKLIPDTDFYYAVKSNNHPKIAKTLATNGFGLDVSSGRELQMAIDVGAEKIVFSGPGKTDRELKLVAEHANHVIVLMDSFSELNRLSQIAETCQTKIQAGIRIAPIMTDSWQKFGIPLDRLQEFWEIAKEKPNIKLSGIQFHTSWNLNPSRQIEAIKALGNEVATWPSTLVNQIKFIDIGGGFWPSRGEWLQSSSTPQGKVDEVLANKPPEWNKHFVAPAVSIESFAKEISNAVENYIFPIVKCKICFEPGRWLSNDAMHLMLSVIDKKEIDMVITDAGTNTVGWERFEHYYAPILNLSNPGVTEHKCHILGSLCTPEDTWGYSYWGNGIKNNDVLLVPNQGSYTYSLRQEFIKPLPKVFSLEY